MIQFSPETGVWLCRRAFQAAPLEACGFILRCGTIVEVRNIASDPHQEFVMDPMDALKKFGTEGLSSVVAVWHTHPRGNARPSARDISAISSGHVNLDWAYLVVTKDEVAQYDPRVLVGDRATV
jgi:proteasome lid subunit RPN8/RPN11